MNKGMLTVGIILLSLIALLLINVFPIGNNPRIIVNKVCSASCITLIVSEDNVLFVGVDVLDSVLVHLFVPLSTGAFLAPSFCNYNTTGVGSLSIVF